MPARGRQSPPPPHGEDSRYRRGCRCEPCCQAHSDYGRAWRQAKAARAAGVSVVQPLRELAPTSKFQPPDEAGMVESAVRLEISGYPLASDRPAVAEAAIALGRGLDSMVFAASHARMVHELIGVLEVLRGKPKSRKLAQVVSMTSARR